MKCRLRSNIPQPTEPSLFFPALIQALGLEFLHFLMRQKPTARSGCATSGTATPGCALLIALALILFTGLATSCRQTRAAAKPDPLARAYDSEPDWNDPQQVISLKYQQAQGKQVFYQYCVWWHADLTPAGPSNCSNLNPDPPPASDGATLNALSDDFMRNVITLDGAAGGKPASMPPWGKILSQDDIEAVIAFYRAIAQPPYQPPARPGPQYSVR
jgi:mono/diheme cytochrome c family protein